MALAQLIVKVGADVSSLTKGLSDAQTKIKNVGDKMTAMGKSFSKNVTLPMVAVGSAAFAAANDFDKARKTIRAGAGATGEALQALEKDFKAVFKGVPESADTVATAIADLNTRTGATGEQLQELATSALQLAKLSGGDVSNQITTVTRVFGDWGIETESQIKTMDYLWKTSQTTGIGVDQLAQKVVQFGAPLRQMGFDFETSVAMLGKWEKEGVNAELVLGSLRIALGKMAKAGITDTNIALTEMIEKIKAAGSVGEANALAMEMFGSRAGPDMAAAIREGRFEIDELLKNLQDSSETIGQAALDTLSFADNMAILKNNAESALQPLGKVLLDIFMAALPTIQKVVDWIERMSTKFEEASPRTRKLIMIIAGLIAAIGPLLILGGMVANGISRIIILNGTLMTMLPALKAAFAAITGPIGLVIAAVLVVAGLAYLIYKNWDKVKPWFANLWNSIKEKTSQIWGSIKQFLVRWWSALLIALTSPIGAIGTLITKNWENIKTSATEIWGGIKSSVLGIVESIFGGINSLFDKFDQLKLKAKGALSGVSFNFNGSGSTASWGNNANGTNYWRGGMTWVGERGPELLNLPRGSEILSNEKSMTMMGSTVNHTGTVTHIFQTNNRQTVAKIVEQYNRDNLRLPTRVSAIPIQA